MLVWGRARPILLGRPFLNKTVLFEWMGRIVPKTVIRGVNFGLGLRLATFALKDYVRAESTLGYWLAGVTFGLTLLLLGNRRFPPALLIILIGVAYACLFKLDWSIVAHSFGLRLPRLHAPGLREIW